MGIPEGILPVEDFNFSADINDLIPGGSDPAAILKVECFSDLDGAAGTLITNPAQEYLITTSGSTWTNYRRNFAIPATTKSIKLVFGVSTGWAGANLKPSSFAFDNLKISVYGGTALFPVPIMGAGQESG